VVVVVVAVVQGAALAVQEVFLVVVEEAGVHLQTVLMHHPEAVEQTVRYMLLRGNYDIYRL
jgi:hypothetical protein